MTEYKVSLWVVASRVDVGVFNTLVEARLAADQARRELYAEGGYCGWHVDIEEVHIV